jgi:hypothetical protein
MQFLDTGTLRYINRSETLDLDRDCTQVGVDRSGWH